MAMVDCDDDIQEITSSGIEIDDSFINRSHSCSSSSLSSAEELDDLVTLLNVPQPSRIDLRGKH